MAASKTRNDKKRARRRQRAKAAANRRAVTDTVSTRPSHEVKPIGELTAELLDQLRSLHYIWLTTLQLREELIFVHHSAVEEVCPAWSDRRGTAESVRLLMTYLCAPSPVFGSADFVRVELAQLLDEGGQHALARFHQALVDGEFGLWEASNEGLRRVGGLRDGEHRPDVSHSVGPGRYFAGYVVQHPVGPKLLEVFIPVIGVTPETAERVRTWTPDPRWGEPQQIAGYHAALLHEVATPEATLAFNPRDIAHRMAIARYGQVFPHILEGDTIRRMRIYLERILPHNTSVDEAHNVIVAAADRVGGLFGASRAVSDSPVWRFFEAAKGTTGPLAELLSTQPGGATDGDAVGELLSLVGVEADTLAHMQTFAARLTPAVSKSLHRYFAPWASGQAFTEVLDTFAEAALLVLVIDGVQVWRPMSSEERYNLFRTAIADLLPALGRLPVVDKLETNRNVWRALIRAFGQKQPISVLPRTYKELLELRGIGPASAGEVADALALLVRAYVTFDLDPIVLEIMATTPEDGAKLVAMAGELWADGAPDEGGFAAALARQPLSIAHAHTLAALIGLDVADLAELVDSVAANTNDETAEEALYFELEVELRQIKPRIWRRFLLRADATFADLHDAIQDAFEWQDYHLWEFKAVAKGGFYRAQSIAGLAVDSPYGEHVTDAREVPLRSHFTDEGVRCDYMYDFGDSWEHRIKLRKIVKAPGTFRRRLLAGRRSAPVEDAGGVPGYYRHLELKETGEDPWGETEELLEWLGGWEPEGFSLSDARRRFDR